MVHLGKDQESSIRFIPLKFISQVLSFSDPIFFFINLPTRHIFRILKQSGLKVDFKVQNNTDENSLMHKGQNIVESLAEWSILWHFTTMETLVSCDSLQFTAIRFGLNPTGLWTAVEAE